MHYGRHLFISELDTQRSKVHLIEWFYPVSVPLWVSWLRDFDILNLFYDEFKSVAVTALRRI